MPVVVFDSGSFLARYPEFNTLSTSLLGQYFTEATFYCRNDGAGPVQDLPTLTIFLNMLTAHIAALNGGVNGQQATQMVGRPSSVGEGSVHVSLDMHVSGGAAWFMQTKYGAAYWQASLPYRLGGHFIIDPSVMQPNPGGYGWPI